MPASYNGRVTKPRGQDEWLRDVEARQRNIVFPDTLNNETRGWRNLIEAGRSTAIQKLGIVVLFIWILGLGLSSAYFISDSFSRSGLLLLGAICLSTTGFIALIILAIRVGIAFAERDIRNREK